MSDQKRRQPSLDPLMEGYLEYLSDVAREARGTVRDVRCTLRRVSQVMERLAPQRPLWKLGLSDYLRWIEEERLFGRSGAGLNKNLSHLRGFLDYAWRSGRADRNVLDHFQIQDDGRRKEPESLSIEEAVQLVKSCPASRPRERRERMVILLLYGCGLRTKELCDLRMQDVDTTRREVIVRAGKGDRQRMVPLPEMVYTELLAYLLERGGKRGPLLRTETFGKFLRQARVRRGLPRSRTGGDRAGDHAQGLASFLRHTLDGSRCGSGRHRAADGSSQPGGDGRLPARFEGSSTTCRQPP